VANLAFATMSLFMKLPALDDRFAATQRPKSSPVMFQRWSELLFLHWEIGVDEIARTLPEGLYPDLHEGKAWLGLVPFYMQNIRPRFLPAVPGISNFLEMNVRTYVHDEQGRPGVWFYSLDANQSLAVSVAQRFFHLPYHRAEMKAEHREDLIHYSCSRRSIPDQTTTFIYSAGEPLPTPSPGSLAYFLVERYYLFAHHKQQMKNLIGQVHHRPYPLVEAKVDQWSAEAIEQAGFNIGSRAPDHSAMSHGVDVSVFAIESVS